MYRRFANQMTAVALTMGVLVMAASPLDGLELRGQKYSGSQEGDLSEVVRSVGVSPDTSALLIVRLEDGVEWGSGGARIETTFLPASTTKIPHTLIALEEGYVDGSDAHFQWDGKERLFEVWNQDQTLLSAFQYSVIWVYQQITRDLGHATMAAWLNRFEYGNRDIGGPEDIETYWLRGPLNISARGQVQFLSRLVTEVLPLSASTYREARLIMRKDGGEDWVLYSKTALAGGIGWCVGWVDRVDAGISQTYIFAFNMDMTSEDELSVRRAVVRAAMNELGVIPKKG